MPLRSILKDFIKHVEYLEQRRLSGDNLYDREFQKLKQLTDRLKNDPGYTCKAGQLEINRRKNRYKDILPYDRTRVVLIENKDEPHSDYINASYIKGSSGSMAYIAAQGPLPQTVNEFWRMVWQCEVQVVVMACNEREGGKSKCDYYWPGLGEKKLYQDIMIHTVKVKKICEDFLVRTWKLNRGSEQRTVCQFHYMTWPDHGIPSSVTPILQMIRLIRNCQATETIPVLVHCSAGCGRTGTFCAIDQVWGLLRSGKLQTMFSLFKMISDMRHQRVAMVQTKEQYMLVHRAVATLFQQQLCIIDSHPYQNINQLGEPLAFVDDNHIYENIDLFKSAFKENNDPAEILKTANTHPTRLDTPPTSGTDTDHSSEEYEAYEARYSFSNSQTLEVNRSVTLPPARYDANDQPALPAKRQSQVLVSLEEEKHIKHLLTELNEANNCTQSTYRHRPNRTSSQDDINITYSPERSFVYISDSDNSDDGVHLHADVVRKPSIARLKALFEKSNRSDADSGPQSRREITRSHSQRVTRSNASPFASPQFYVPVIKSDSFSMFDKNARQRPALARNDVDPNFNTIGHMQDAVGPPPEKPKLPKKQRKNPTLEPNSTFYYREDPVCPAQQNDINQLRNRSNEFTSTGTRKPPVLPRKKFIGGRSTTSGKPSGQVEVFEAIEPRLTPNGAVLEDEAEKFHGSGGSVFYGPCANEGNGDASPEVVPAKKSPYTNVSPHAQKNLEQIQSVIEQSPRGAIIDLTSTVRKSISQASSENKLPIDSDSSSGSQNVTFDVTLPPKKPNKGYEPIWLGPNEKMSASSIEAKPATLIRESNYGRITPRCKSEEKLLDGTQAKAAASAYGRIVHKASSEPPSALQRFNPDANSTTGSSSTAQSSDNYSSSDSSTGSSNKHDGSTTTVPNLLMHSPLVQRKLSSSENKTAVEPEFNMAVAEIRNLIDELMLDSSGAVLVEPPRRERCHSLDLLCPDQGEARQRRPSTDLLDDSLPTFEAPKQTMHDIPPVSPAQNIPRDDDDSVYYTAEETKPVQACPDPSWAASNWSEKLKLPPEIDYKAMSSTVLRHQRPYEDKKSRANITRSVSAREAKRPIVVVRRDDQFKSNCATMRQLNALSFDQPKPRKPHPLPETEPGAIHDDGYVTLAETSCLRNGRNQAPEAEVPKIIDECHQYATIQYSDHGQKSRAGDRLSYRTLPQPPPPSSSHDTLPSSNVTAGNEHIYSLPTLPKYRPPPPPPPLQKLSTAADLPTPPPSSEETSSSSSQGDARTEPLYSQIQKPRKELPPFILPESVVSTGYGHILSKSNFSHDDLEVSDKPVAPPRRGRKQQHKYSRHSLLDIESSKKCNWHEDDFRGDKSSPQWLLKHHQLVTDQDSESEESAPHIPQKTAAAFQVPDEVDAEDMSEDSPSSGASLNSSVGSGTNLKLDDSHGSSILSRSISRAFGKLNLFNRLAVKPDPSVMSENSTTSESIHSQTSPRKKCLAEIQAGSGTGFANKRSKHAKASRPIPTTWKN